MERFIFGGISIDGSYTRNRSSLYFINPVVHSSDYKPEFKVFSLDIETGRDGSIYSIGIYFTSKDFEEKIVIMRSEEFPSGYKNEYIKYYQQEKELITQFIYILNYLDPDIIIGWHVIGFDLDFIQRRGNFYNIPLKIGRDLSIPTIKKNIHNNWMCNINGRIIIDGPPTLRGAFYTFENYKLETVANEVLGIGKDIDEKGKVDEIERRFREDKKALAHYNILDAILVTQIFNKLSIIDLVYTRAITSGLTMDRVGMSVAAFDFFMLPQIHRKGFVAPDSDDMVMTHRGSGGLVFIKEPGFYESIIVLDFKSLYPSIIRTFFIDPLSRINSKTDPLLTPVNIAFSRTENVLPSYISSLMNKRENAKKSGDMHLSQAIKILMNSFYGVMGTPLSRFYHPDLPDAITGSGQWFLNLTREYLEERGYNVIYGDTDSVFVQLKKDERENYDKKGKEITEEINNYLNKIVKDRFNLESLLEIEYEKHFSKFFLPGLNGQDSGAKKRYAGILSTEKGDILSFAGMEFVRSDWTILAKEFQYRLFELIFNSMEVENYIKEIVKKLLAGEFDNKLIYKKKLTKPAKTYTKIVPPQVKAALLIDPEGNSIRSIEYIMTHEGPIPLELSPGNIDYDHYIEKQLKPIADRILPFIKKDFETIVFNKQPELF